MRYWQSAALLSLTTACSPGGGNSGQVVVSPEVAAAAPWSNGVVPAVNPDGSLVTPSLPVFPAIARDTPDPGWGPIDCGPFTIVTFEADPTVMSSVGVGEAFSSYDDNTYGALRVPGDANWYPGLVGRFSAQWGLTADRINNGPSCNGQPNNWAMHVRGGRFNYYGMGVEHPLGAIVACPPGSDLCPSPPAPGATVDSVGLPTQRADGLPFAQQAPHNYWDVSQYDGVVLWARGGPDGQAGLLVALQDKHTSDALNRENNTFCRRIKNCIPTCQNNLPCTLMCNNIPCAAGTTFDPTDRGMVYRCVDPAVGMGTEQTPDLSEIEQVYRVCGASTCRSPDYYLDYDFDPYPDHADHPELDNPAMSCKHYEFDGAQADRYCYGAEPPPDMSERCGDGWVAPITLSTEWQIYVIPFTEFRQVGFGKQAPFLDLHSIYEVAFELPVGFTDVYIDNLTFYRHR